jgi:hypothetical protein
VKNLRRRLERLEAAVGPPEETIRLPVWEARAIKRLADEDRELAELISIDALTYARWIALTPQERRHHATWHRLYGPGSPSERCKKHPRFKETKARYDELRFEECAYVVAERTGDRLLPLLMERYRFEREALKSGSKELDLGSLDPDATPRAYLITDREQAIRRWLRNHKAAVWDREEALQPVRMHPLDPDPEPTEPITDEAEAQMRFIEHVARIEEAHRRHVAYSERHEQQTNRRRI